MPKDGKKTKAEVAATGAVAAARREACEADAEVFKALGDPTRLSIVVFLRACLRDEDAAEAAALVSPKWGGAGDEEEDEDDEGDGHSDEAPPVGSVTVGEVACHVLGSDKVSSTLSHHLKELRRAGLITMKRRGKNVLCRLDAAAVERLASRLLRGAAAGPEA